MFAGLVYAGLGVALAGIDLEAPEPAPVTYSSRHALLIGMSNYEDRTGWRDLPNVAEDVGDLEAVLRDQQDFGSVTTVLDATRAEVDDALASWLRDMARLPDAEDALLLVFYAGHGYTTTSATGEDLGWIVPVDAERPGDVGLFQAGALSMRRFLEVSETARARHMVFVFDSCFSGGVFDLASRGAPQPQAITSRLSQPVRRLYTAGTKNETVPDDSVFHAALVNALTSSVADANADGFVTGVELGEFLYDVVKRDRGDRQTPQYGTIRPRGGGAEGDVVFGAELPSVPEVAVGPTTSVHRGGTGWTRARVGLTAGGGALAAVGAGTALGTWAWGRGVQDGQVTEGRWRTAEALNVAGLVAIGAGVVLGTVGAIGPGTLQVRGTSMEVRW
jgi:hypothetical protein